MRSQSICGKTAKHVLKEGSRKRQYLSGQSTGPIRAKEEHARRLAQQLRHLEWAGGSNQEYCVYTSIVDLRESLRFVIGHAWCERRASRLTSSNGEDLR